MFTPAVIITLAVVVGVTSIAIASLLRNGPLVLVTHYTTVIADHNDVAISVEVTGIDNED